jgi:hypothetical protein
MLPDTRLKFEIEAKLHLKWLTEHAARSRDTGVIVIAGEASDILNLMRARVNELIRKELDKLEKLSHPRFVTSHHLARVVGCSITWVEDYLSARKKNVTSESRPT